jgi:hypothetical protein
MVCVLPRAVMPGAALTVGRGLTTNGAGSHRSELSQGFIRVCVGEHTQPEHTSSYGLGRLSDAAR